MTDQTPIAWLALERGTPIYSSENEEIGEVDEVIADRQKDIFSGITFRTGVTSSTRFIPADRIERLNDGAVHTTLAAHEAGSLEPYEP